MSGFVQDLLNQVAGGFLGNQTILRDYQHASKAFRSNSYANAPKLKFLFHTYFSINPNLGFDTAELAVLFKEVKLPSFSFQTAQLNQYNRKRIIQTKIKYDPIEISFHDDNGNHSTQMWEAYYKYYYNDANKPGSVISGPGVTTNSVAGYNSRNIYDANISNDLDWGFLGGQSTSSGTKIPFFKNITIFGFNQHNFTAYTLVNPIITSFGHDSYNYADGGSTMTNRMTLDYETVVYTYGAMDGRSPGNIVAGFGDPSYYDTTPSPIVGQGQGTILGQGGLVDAAGGVINAVQNGNVLGAVAAASAVYNSVYQLTSPNNANPSGQALNALLAVALNSTPTTRNAAFTIPVAAATPGVLATAGSPTINAMTAPTIINQDAVMTGPTGVQYSASTTTGQIIAPNLNDPTQAELDQVLTTAGTPVGSDIGFVPNPPFNVNTTLA